MDIIFSPMLPKDDNRPHLENFTLPLSDAAARNFFRLDQFIAPGCWSLQDWQLLRGDYFLCAVSKKQGTEDSLFGALLGVDPVQGEVGHLLKLVMHPEMRRQGGANTLLEHYLGHLRSKGARSLYLEVAAKNFQAISFYRKSGLKDLCVKKKFYQSGEDALSMELLLI